MGAIVITLMGPPQLHDEGQARLWPSRKLILLLSYLLLEPGRHARDELAGLFWPESEQGVARSALRTVLTQLRRLLPDRLRVEGSLVNLELQLGDTVDALGREAAPSDQPFLVGVEVAEEGEFKDWLTAMRAHLHTQQRTRLQRQTQHLQRSGEFTQALAVAERWFALDRTDEDAAQVLMTLARQVGSVEQLHDAYERHRHTLAQQVDAEPSPRIQGLLAELQADLVQGVLGDADVFRFPSLPTRSSSFVGREDELIQMHALTESGARVVTLQGLGGIGKTRLALALGAALQRHFPDRVAFVPLEILQTPQEIPRAILTALGLTGDAGTAALDQVIQIVNVQRSVLILDNFEHLLDGAGVIDTLVARCPTLTVVVTSREALGLEQEHRYPVLGLVPNDRAGGAQVGPTDAARLFAQRARQVNPSFQLTETTLPQVEQVCRVVGGVPLAIELAASWLRVLSVDELLHDLTLNLDTVSSSTWSRPPRQHSLRTVFDYSWARLTPHEQGALAALSVFQGGFIREAARDVAGASIQVLARLVDMSLLQVGRDGRFDLHPVISQYAQEELEGSGTADHVKDQHARCFSMLAAGAFPHLYAVDRDAWLGRLGAEHLNLARTLDHLRQTGQAQAVLGLCADLANYWVQSGLEGAGRHWLREAIQEAGAATGTREYMRAQCLLGMIFTSPYHVPEPDELQWIRDGVEGCRRHGERRTLVFGLWRLALLPASPGAEERRLIEEAWHISADLGDPAGQVVAENALGILARRTGNIEEAQRHFERALTRAQGLADPTIAHVPLYNLAVLAFRSSDYERGVQLFEAMLSYARQEEQAMRVARYLVPLGETYPALGRFETARTTLREALGLYRQHSHRDAASTVLLHLASVAVDMSDLEEAERLLQEAQREAGDGWRWPEWRFNIQGRIYSRRQRVDAARDAFLTVMSARYADGEDMTIFLRNALEHYLTVPHPAASGADLAGLLGILAVLQARVVVTMAPDDRAACSAAHQQLADRIRNELGEDEFEQIIGATWHLSLTEAGELVQRHALSLLDTS